MNTPIARPGRTIPAPVGVPPALGAHHAVAIAIIAFPIAYYVGDLSLAAQLMLGWLSVVCLYYALVDFTSALAVYAFLTPLEHALTAWSVSYWNTLSYLAIAMLFASLFNRNAGLRLGHFRLPERMMVAMLLWETVSLAWSDEQLRTGLGLVLSDGAGLLVMMIYYRSARSEETVLRWLRYYIAGNLFYAIMLWQKLQVGELTVWNADRGREIASIAGANLEISPNLFARTCMVGLFAALAVSEFDATARRRRLGQILAVAFGASIALSYGRTSLLAGMVALLAWAAFGRSQGKRMQNVAVGILIIGTLAVTIWYVNPEMVLARFRQTVEGYETGDYNRLSSGRADIWSEGWEMFTEQPLLGVGFGAFSLKYADRTGDLPRNTHNMYLERLAETGLIGGMLFLAVMASLGAVAWRSGRWRHIAIAWWCALAIAVFGATIGRAKEFWFAFGVVLFFSQPRTFLPGRRFVPIPPAARLPAPAPNAP